MRQSQIHGAERADKTKKWSPGARTQLYLGELRTVCIGVRGPLSNRGGAYQPLRICQQCRFTTNNI